MARKKVTTSKPDEAWERQVKGMLAQASDLLLAHCDEIKEALDQADDHCLTVGIQLALDHSESAPSVKVGIRFSSAVTDSRTIMFDDPKQMTFNVFSPEELKAKRDASKEGEAPGGGDAEPEKPKKPKKPKKDKPEGEPGGPENPY